MKYYFGTILMESNRWNKTEKPCYKPSDWIDPIQKAGYGGIELWENHGYEASDAEIDQLKKAFPVIIFNTYDHFEGESAAHRKKASQLINRLGAGGCKFNFGNDPSLIESYKKNFTDWAADFPDDFRLICECHGKTVCETPERAAEILNSLDDPRVEALVHMKQDQNSINSWFDSLGSKITHCHANLMRCAHDPWTTDAIDFDFRESIRIIGQSSVKTMTLEFTQGVGEGDEKKQVLFDRGVRDMKKIKEIVEL